MPFYDLIANTSGREQDIVDRKMALEIVITPLHAHQICWTLVHKQRKWDLFSTHSKSTFSDAHISGAKGRCPL